MSKLPNNQNSKPLVNEKLMAERRAAYEKARSLTPEERISLHQETYERVAEVGRQITEAVEADRAKRPISLDERDLLEFGDKHCAAIEEHHRKKAASSSETPTNPDAPFADRMGFMTMTVSMALYGYALSCGPNDQYAGDLCKLLRETKSEESKEEFESAFLKLVNAIKNGHVSDQLCLKALEYATYDADGMPKISTQAGAASIQEYAEQIQERLALEQTKTP